MKDIVTYTESEGKSLATIFGKLGLPSLGPSIGCALLRQIAVLNRIEAEHRNDWEESMLDVLRNYRARLQDIVAVESSYQEQIIARLEMMIRKMGKVGTG